MTEEELVLRTKYKMLSNEQLDLHLKLIQHELRSRYLEDLGAQAQKIQDKMALSSIYGTKITEPEEIVKLTKYKI